MRASTPPLENLTLISATDNSNNALNESKSLLQYHPDSTHGRSECNSTTRTLSPENRTTRSLMVIFSAILSVGLMWASIHTESKANISTLQRHERRTRCKQEDCTRCNELYRRIMFCEASANLNPCADTMRFSTFWWNYAHAPLNLRWTSLAEPIKTSTYAFFTIWWNNALGKPFLRWK